MTSVVERGLLEELSAGKVVCEIGSWHGGSLAAIAATAATAHSVDWHRGMDEHRPEPDADTLPKLWANVRSLPNVVLHVGRTEQVVPCFRDRLFGFAFIDGSHDADAVERDARLLLPKMRRGALVALHDFGIGLGVDEAVHRVWGEPLRVVGSVAVCHA